MPKLTVDGIEVEVQPGMSVLQACEAAGKEIPRFCYHERLSVAGNCRMCLVEMERAPKPIASCAMPAADGMVIRTDTDQVRAARRGVMEFLLINHPLDCPICDQGGECDLQDQAMAYGFDRSRYEENKRAVSNKHMGPLIKTIMTRCIHCTRCVRFATEVAGVSELGMLNRGENAEITTYLEGALNSELSANVIDLCPVGALTSRPYAFNARPWELTKTESIDVMDAVGSNIRVDARGREVMRVLPRLHEDVNEEWISDKTRYACDGLRRQRLDQPYVRIDGKLQPANWDQALSAVADKLGSLAPTEIAAIAGDQCDAESMFALKSLMTALGTPHLDCRQDGAKLDAKHRASYLFNTTIAGIEDSDACLLIGTNPRWEAPLINARLRKRWLRGGFKVAMIGAQSELTFDCEYLGAGPETLNELVEGRHPFASVLKAASRPMLVLGMGALARPDGAAILAAARSLAEETGMVLAGDGEAQEPWNGFNVLHGAAARVAGLDIGFVPGTGGKDVGGILADAKAGKIKAVYLLAADELDLAALRDCFVIYQGHHGDAGAHVADVILPGAAYTEKNGLYANTEGRVQLGRRAVFPPGDAREDWTILRALSARLDHTLPFDDLTTLRQKLVEAHPVFAGIDTLEPAKWSKFGRAGKLSGGAFASAVDNFYMTCPISRASQTMAECTEELVNRAPAKTGTEG
ncbi:MAG: NADH-quinone oxidoreductase subunit NuoG [Alphaproteobacteria bacterium]|nr:NADH-quinone oxidoreductase subunit NuoG [Alphaproteobacteria bacterium]